VVDCTDVFGLGCIDNTRAVLGRHGLPCASPKRDSGPVGVSVRENVLYSGRLTIPPNVRTINEMATISTCLSLTRHWSHQVR